MVRVVLLLHLFAAASSAWVESVEFPWQAYPKQLRERELAWIKNIGIAHVSLPQGGDSGELAEVIQIVRRLDMEADLEGPVPAALQPLMRAHGGPLTEPMQPQPARISTLNPAALTLSRELRASGVGALLWADVEDTLGPGGYRAGAVNFAGEETSATAALRRDARLAAYWGQTFAAMRETPGAGLRLGVAPEGLTVKQFVGNNGVSVVSVVNKSRSAWAGDLKALYPAAKRAIGLAGVTVGARDVLWLPVNVPLSSGPLCKDCNAFATVDHLVYATAELTGMEYENGILAMEFAAPAGGEVVLQLSREPSGPLVAGGRPVAFDWDEHEQRARLKIPAGMGAGNRVRIGLAIEPPDATAFFDSARVLIIGETNRLRAQFSSEEIAQRSRLRATPAYAVEQAAGKEPLTLNYAIKVPETAVHGDHAELAIEADGIQMSHAQPQLLRPASLHFADAVSVHLAANSTLALAPATVPVNQRTGREVTITVRNNAPEIRSFHVGLTADGLEFLPAQMDVVVGASTAREISFRVFSSGAEAGVHAGVARLSGAATATEQVQFVVLPQNRDVAFSAAGFSIIENARFRASFWAGRWLEFVDKENNQNLLPGGGIPFIGERPPGLDELQRMIPKPKR